MRILVTGGNGFIGSHFVDAAVKAGHTVRVLSRKPAPVFQHGQPFSHLPGGYEALAAHPEWLDGIDTVVHAAWSTVPKTAAADIQGDIQANVAGSQKLFEILSGAKSLRHLIFLSSGGAVYGAVSGERSIAETQSLEPIGAYGVGKLAAENYARLFSRASGIPVTIVRPSNPYGLGQISIGVLGLISTFLFNGIHGHTSKVFGDGGVVRDYLDVKDLAQFLLLCSENPVPDIYNCGSGTGTSINEIITIIEEVTERKLNIERCADRPFDPARVVLDISKAREQLGWSPQITLRDGLASYAAEVLKDAR